MAFYNVHAFFREDGDIPVDALFFRRDPPLQKLLLQLLGGKPVGIIGFLGQNLLQRQKPLTGSLCFRHNRASFADR